MCYYLADFDGANSSSQLLFLMFGDMSLSRLQLYG